MLQRQGPQLFENAKHSVCTRQLTIPLQYSQGLLRFGNSWGLRPQENSDKMQSWTDTVSTGSYELNTMWRHEVANCSMLEQMVRLSMYESKC